MWKWIVIFATFLMYVYTFNHIAKLYFASENTMTWKDLYRKYVPKTHFEIDI